MTNNLDLKQQFITLRAKGFSLEKIAKELNKCRQTLSNWNSELEEEISNAKAIELESLFEECFLTKEHRVKNISNLLSTVSNELAKRDFQDVATEKLVEMKMKLTDQLKTEYIQPNIKSEKQMAKAKSSRQLFGS
jgi:orotate phosphoribosyltransferase-like protein